MTVEHSRREFLRFAGLTASAGLLPGGAAFAQAPGAIGPAKGEAGKADYTLRIATTPIEIAPDRIISVTNYNGQFPGPLLRLKE
ncbi:MAG TPA: copper oxidase, partial [Candidatus Bathyarchaeia archaeon]|nr:copper oxidase [Candidatus Bathyarchaeia archaeon]